MKVNTWLEKIKLLAVVAFIIPFLPCFVHAKTAEEKAVLFAQEIREGQKEGKSLNASQYVPGELIVKFKEGVNPQSVLKAIEIEPKSLERVHSIKPALARFKKAEKLEKESDGWYWFLGKKYKEADSISDEEFFKAAYNKMMPEEKSLFRSYKINLPQGIAVEEAIAKLKNNPDVEYAEPNHKVHVWMLPNDPYYFSSGGWGQAYDDLWGLKKIYVEPAWDISQGEGVVVAVIDSGVCFGHIDLKNNIWKNTDEIPNNGIDDDGNGYIDDVNGYDFAYGNNKVWDNYGHGTHVAGIIAAEGNNSLGVIGVAPKAKIMVVKGLDDTGYGTDEMLANSVVYAANNGANILNNSWGGGCGTIIDDAFDYAYSKGCLSIAAAGNDNTDVMASWPARLDKVIAVSALTQNDEKCAFSNYGSKIEVGAPGGGYDGELGGGSRDEYNILSTGSNISVLGRSYPEIMVSEGYMRLAGTSMACPYVAGAAALILSRYPELSNEEVRQRIRLSCDDIGEPGRDNYFGFGRLNAYSAVNVDMAISFPAENAFVRGAIDIQGSASMLYNFKEYELYYAAKDNAQSSVLISSSFNPVTKGVLGRFDTTALADGQYMLILKAIDIQNKEWRISRSMAIDNINQPPAFQNLVNHGAVIGGTLTFKVEATDPDDPKTPCGQLQYRASGLPAGAQFNPEAQIFSWQPTDTDKGIYTVYFTVADNRYSITKKVILTTIYLKNTQITTDLNNQLGPDIFGDKIVWADWRNGLSNADIYSYDLSAHQEAQVTTNSYRQNSPAIYGSKIIYDDDRIGASQNQYRKDIFLYDLVTAQEEQITDIFTAGTTRLHWARLFGDKIVWEYGNNTMADIYLYNITTGEGKDPAEDAYGANKLYPDVYEDKIVWVAPRINKYDIYFKDLTTGQVKQITTVPGAKFNLRLYGDKIFWLDSRKDPYKDDVYIYDLSRFQERQISTSENDKYDLEAFGDKAVWVELDSSGDSNIHLYDLSKEIEATLNFNGASGPRIYQNKIAWANWVGGKTDIYLTEIFYPPRINYITPKQLLRGNFFVIAGKDFGYSKQDARVEFPDGMLAEVQSWSNTRIICRVPEKARSGLLKVITLGGESKGVHVTVDASAPKNYIKINNGAAYTHTVNVTLNLSVPDEYSRRRKGVQMRFSNDNIRWSAPEPYANTRSWALTPGDGMKIVYAKFRNSAGNWPSPVNDTIVLQTTLPAEITAPAPNSMLTSSNVKFQWNAGLGVSGYKLNVGSSAGGNDIYAGSVTTGLSDTLYGIIPLEGRPVYVRLCSHIGLNWVAKDYVYQTKDLSAPIGTIKINNGDTNTNSPNIMLALSATDTAGPVVQMRFSNDGSAWSAPEPYATVKSWILSGPDGTNVVYVKYMDQAGNWSIPYQGGIILDTTPPTGSILINNGAETTFSSMVTLNLAAQDAYSAVIKMKFSEDNVNWTPPENYASIKTWLFMVPPLGSRTIYVKFQDGVGNWSTAYSDSIIVNSVVITK